MLHAIQANSGLYSKEPRLISIAPAPISLDVKRCNIRSNTYVGAQAASIARRNARERNRVKQVNDGYNALRKRLPAAIVTALSGGSRRGSGKKLSKVDTLKMVVEYIRYLEKIIEDNDSFGAENNQFVAIERNNVEPAEATVIRAVKYEDVTKEDLTRQYEDEGVFDRTSPYTDSVPSPVESESSGVYSAYNGYYENTSTGNHLMPMEEDELLDAISWWQHK